MINIAVVDDDKMILDQIKELINKEFINECTIDLYSDSVEFYNNNDKWCYDIVFLDIDIPKMSGFEIAETISLLKRQIAIVFVSNLEHLVYDSLKFRPFRFVRKSFLADDIISAVEAFMTERRRSQDVFLIKTNGTTIPTAVSDIVYFESMGHDISVRIANDLKYQILRERNSNLTIQSLSEEFENKGFIRAHKSFLINYKYIYVIKRSEVVLKNHETVSINPHKAGEIREKFKEFIMKEGI